MIPLPPPKISVIVPVFNVEKYLPGCIRSIRECAIHLPENSAELILVDDGSVDGSGAICDKAGACYDGIMEVKVIHQQNRGLSAARNAGLDVARGDWFTFVDSDDMLHPWFLAHMLAAAESGSEIDMVSCRMKRFFSVPKFKTLSDAKPKMEIISGVDAARNSLYQTGKIDNSACGKFYNRHLWDDNRFTLGILYEDLDILYKLMLQSRQVVLVNEKLYWYRRNPESILGKFNLKRTDVLNVTDGICQYVAENCPVLFQAARSRRLSAHFNILLLYKKHGVYDREIEHRCLRVIREQSKMTLRDRRVRLKNKLGILAFNFFPGYFRLKKTK